MDRKIIKKVCLVSNGDFRDSVSVLCWPKQDLTLHEVERAFNKLNIETVRINPYKTQKKHGFITTQAEGCKLFAEIDSQTPVIIVLSSWAWAHHVASSLKLHNGPILLLGNFDGTWPGLVALLNHSAVLERLNIHHSKIWSSSFSNDPQFMKNLQSWIEKGCVNYPMDHITNIKELTIPSEAEIFGKELAANILKYKRIIGQMDPGCMGMLNAVLSPDKIAAIGIPIELLNQSDLLAEMNLVSDEVAANNLKFLEEKDTIFHWGKEYNTELVRNQVLEQMKMYTAAGIIYKRYGLAAIGIPYQYGLVRCTSASDLPEGMLNNSDRPDIVYPETGEIINNGSPIIHFNEGDLGSAIPQVLMYDILRKKRMPSETTLHDVRWGDWWEDRFIWVLEISGGGPPAHWGGWENTHVYRQPTMYFPKGGGTCSGVSRPGEITWARFYESFEKIGMDIGTGEAVRLPDDEVRRRLNATTKEWPIANVYIPGYEKDQLMSSHKSNHITICYGNIIDELASTAKHIGLRVNVIGDARRHMS